MFYVYQYSNPLKITSGKPEPFYIGKGKNKRYIQHLFKSHLERDPNKHKTNTIKLILRHNQQPAIEIIATYLLEADALAHEMRLIKMVGRADLGLGGRI